MDFIASRYAKQFYTVLVNGDVQSLLQLKPDKRIHAMKALPSLSHFLGSHDVWLQLRQRYHLTWSTGPDESFSAAIALSLSLFFIASNLSFSTLQVSCQTLLGHRHGVPA
jgi:hypothetical protein